MKIKKQLFDFSECNSDKNSKSILSSSVLLKSILFSSVMVATCLPVSLLSQERPSTSKKISNSKAPKETVKTKVSEQQKSELKNSELQKDATSKEQDTTDFDLEQEIGASENQEVVVDDPIEGFNRGIFWFNDKLDTYLLEPVATGYDYVTPDVVQGKIGNFFRNLKFPINFVSDTLQLDYEQVLEDSGAFLINTTLGGLGLFDVASEFGLKRRNDDVGVAFGRWGIGEGAYIVLPLLGPSNIRDGVGSIFDSLADPLFLATVVSSDSAVATTSVALGALRIIDRRSQLLQAVTAAKDSSLDYYLFVRSAYAQIRRKQIENKDFSDADAMLEKSGKKNSGNKGSVANEKEEEMPGSKEPKSQEVVTEQKD